MLIIGYSDGVLFVCCLGAYEVLAGFELEIIELKGVALCRSKVDRLSKVGLRYRAYSYGLSDNALQA